MIKAGKTFMYRTSFSDEMQRNLVRTGTHADGNCFIHALLTAIDPNYRRQSSHYAHVKLVREFRQQLSEWVTPEVFRSLGNGEQLRLHFLAALNEVLEETFLHTSPSNAYEEVLRSIVSFEDIDKDILPSLTGPETKNFYLAFCEKIDARLRTALNACEASKATALRQWTQQFFIELFEQAHTQSLKEFRARLERMGEYADSLQMECIARFTGYNFLFLREQEQDAYPGLSHVVTFEPTRQCLIFLWVDENHFEIIGDLERANVINRIFEADDALIQWLLTKNASNSTQTQTKPIHAVCA